MDALNKDNITLANRLYSKGFESELDTIMNVITKLVKAKEGHDLQMWRFGRIFDSKFLSNLQPKCCVHFMLVLHKQLSHYSLQQLTVLDMHLHI